MAEGGGIKAILYAFVILSIITIVEVIFGIIRPSFMVDNHLLGLTFLNWFFVILTLTKAYYIVWYFMHVKYEYGNLRIALVAPIVVFVAYLAFILLYEADQVYDLFKNFIS